jgi:3-phenylpropionate/trans-cinnamate dioxygenase ferredoxin component
MSAVSHDEVSFVEIAPLSDLPSGERMFLDIGDEPVVLFNIAGNVYAIGDVCTHDGGPLGEGEMDGHQIICPRHGARFDVRNGKALTMPAIVDTPSFPVEIRDGIIYLGIPK